MNVSNIVKQYMERNGYTALCGDECGCALDDLMPCGGSGIADCCVGYANHCSTCGKRETCPDERSADYNFICLRVNCWTPKNT